MPDQMQDDREAVTEIAGFWRLPEEERREMERFMRDRKAAWEQRQLEEQSAEPDGAMAGQVELSDAGK